MSEINNKLNIEPNSDSEEKSLEKDPTQYFNELQTRALNEAARTREYAQKYIDAKSKEASSLVLELDKLKKKAEAVEHQIKK